MHNKMIVTTAALALLAGTNIAFAQTSGSPSGGAAGAHEPQHGRSMQGGAHENAAQPSGRHGAAERGARSNEDRNSGQADRNDRDRNDREGQRAGSHERGNQGQRAGENERGNRAGQRAGSHERGNQGQRSGENERGNGMNRNGRTGRGENTGSAPASVNITTEQRTRIREHRTELNAGRMDHVTFSVHVGTVVPHSVRLHTLPPDIVEIVPEYRGYRYIVVQDEILIIDPHTLRIVAVLDV